MSLPAPSPTAAALVDVNYDFCSRVRLLPHLVVIVLNTLLTLFLRSGNFVLVPELLVRAGRTGRPHSSLLVLIVMSTSFLFGFVEDLQVP